MSGSLNRVMLIGNLTRDPEIRNLGNGGKVCNLTIATSERWRDKNTGEKKEASEFHRCVLFNEQLVGIAEAYLRKGSKVYLSGSLQTRSWEDQGGQKRYSTEIVCQRFRGELVMLDSAKGDAHEPAASDDESYVDDIPWK